MSTAPSPDGGRNEPPSPIQFPRRLLRLLTPPRRLTAMLGRESEVAAVAALLADDTVRLVTLVGPGGIGKTRLALGVAAVIAETFEDQVAWADVTTAATPEAVAAALAQAVGLTETGDAPVVESLMFALRDARLLLIIDNFEQVLGAAPLLRDLLLACPLLTLLVTSRALLRIAGEHPFDVRPLSTAATSSGSETAPAVELFAQRAATVYPAFGLTSDNVPIVTDICQKLDGLPLAIELAAARANHLPLPVLRDRLDRRLPLLTIAERGAPDRHRTMHDAIAWSYDQLTVEQQTLFRCLAVFSGGFTLDAAEAVAGDAPNLLSILGVLVDNSLVRLESQDQVGARYTMLETIREFAAAQLAASGDDIPRRRHAEHYLSLALWVGRTYWGDEPGDARAQVRIEEANLRAAVGWALAHGEVDMATHLAIAMFDPLSHTGDNGREQRTLLRRALALPGGSPAARAFALTRCAALVRLDQLAEGIELAEEALGLAYRHGDAFGMAESQRVLGNIAIHTGDRARARSCLLDALARFRELGMQGRVGWTLHHLSVLEGIGAEAEPALAAAYCEEGLAIFRDLEHLRGVEATLSLCAECAFKDGDLAASLASAREGFAMVSSSSWSYDYLDRIADIARSIGLAEVAARLYGAAAELRDRAARPIEPGFRAGHEARVDLARLALGEEAFAAAYAAGRLLSPRQVETEALAVTVSPVAAPDSGAPRGALSPREFEVMRMLAAGLSDRAIADALFIGERTVNTHVARVFAKLGVRNRAAAVTAAVAAGLVDPDSIGKGAAQPGQASRSPGKNQ